MNPQRRGPTHAQAQAQGVLVTGQAALLRSQAFIRHTGPGGSGSHALEMLPTQVVIGCFVEQVLGAGWKASTSDRWAAASKELRSSPILMSSSTKSQPRCFSNTRGINAIKSYTSSNIFLAPFAATPASCAFWPCTSGEPASKPTSVP